MQNSDFVQIIIYYVYWNHHIILNLNYGDHSSISY